MHITPLASIIVPAFNESKTIGPVLLGLREVVKEYNYEVLLVDDGSTDDTYSLMCKFNEFKTIRNVENLGKTQSIARAISYSSSDIILIQDADLEYPVKNIPKIISVLKDSSVDACYGERLQKNQALYPTVIGRFLISVLLRILFNSKIRDVNTGHKAFKKSSFKRGLVLQSDGFGFCAELTMKLLSEGLMIKEIPIDYFPRNKKDGKKISGLDGIKIILLILLFKFKAAKE